MEAAKKVDDQWHDKRLEAIEAEWHGDCKKLLAENERLREALEKIAGMEEESPGGWGYIMANVARAALHKETNEMNNIQQPSADDHIGTLVYHNVRDDVDQLAAALALAQAEMKPPKFDKVNPHFKAKYASLASIQAATIPALSKHGLSVTQFCKAGMIVIRLMHKSGQYIDSELPITGGTPQQLRSELTYKKRYLWSASCGISADDDDDANAAETKHDAKTGEVIENGTSPDELITPVQRDALIEIADERGVDKAEFCKRYAIPSLADIPASQYQKALTAMKAFKVVKK